jgi:riboflavin kinase / FMN adenylyltransferase
LASFAKNSSGVAGMLLANSCSSNYTRVRYCLDMVMVGIKFFLEVILKVINSLQISPSPWRRPVVTIGNFDGLHLGHRLIIKKLRERASELGVEAVAATFYPHPARVLRPGQGPLPLSSLQQRIEAIKSSKVDGLWVLPFDDALAKMTAHEFVAEFLVGKLNISGLVLGEDARFGRDRAGNLELLKELSQEFGFFVDIVSDLLVEEERVSSTRIRHALSEGEVELVSRLLGHLYSLKGEVTLGHRRGRKLGFPTANLWVEDLMAPGIGVYACFARLGPNPDESKVLPCVTSIGTRPTFDNGPISIEAHILDFDENIYGMPLSLEFVSKLRDEKKFHSAEALIEAMYRDKEDARAILADYPIA